jgi:hemerythrin-like domain-containing protein
MQPTALLMNEHRIIEQVLNCLEKILDRCAVENDLDTRSAMQAIEFFRGFVDGCHHTKEENHLFPLMEVNGFASGCSPVAIMFREHELGRLYIQGMDAAIRSYAAGDAESLNWFIQHAQSYLKLIREHIHKEDMCLFPAANHRLTESDQQQLLGIFEKLAADEIGQGVPDHFLRLANELADRLGVPRAEIDGRLCHKAHQAHGITE